MRCVLVGPSAPLRGGLAIDNDARARALRDAGHEAITVGFSRLYPTLFFPGKSQHVNDAEQTDLLGLPGIDSITPLSWLRTAYSIIESRPDVVTFQWWHPFFCPCYVTILHLLKKHLANCARILISHHARPHESIIGQDTAVRTIATRCTDIVAYSESDADVIRFLAPDRNIHIQDYPLLQDLPPKLVRKDAQHSLKLKGRVLLFFGYVRPYKGLHMLLEALALVSRSLDLSLLVAGEFYMDEGATHRLIHQLGLRDRVHIVNRYINQSEWAKMFGASDALVLPYLRASQSMTIPLAYGFGTPVIATRVGGFSQVIEHGKTGVLADPTPESLARAIKEFYTNFLSADNSEAIIAKRQEFGWQPFVNLLENTILHNSGSDHTTTNPVL